MLRTWLEPHSISVPPDFINAIGGNPLVSQVLFLRGLTDIQSAMGFLSPTDYHPAASSDIPNLDQAVDLILNSLAIGKTIGVWGDFDVDGQTSTTVLVSALRQLGGKVTYHIPVRAEESHGISLPALKKFLGLGVDLIITCDTGITSHEEIEFAQKSGVPVIVTDHHDLPDVLPGAAVIVDPKMLASEHPLSTLPGVGVAYKIVEELSRRQGEASRAHPYLDLVALGIVADIALLKGDTRYLLQLGLETLRHTTRTGLLAMMELSELNPANLTEEHISFILAPRMNALGRLDDANGMVELLTTTDMGRARTLALELEGMNAQRKLLTDQVYQAAQAQIADNPGFLDLPIVVLSHPTWPAGVIGVVASRLVDQYHRPVILLSAPPGVNARGSARSIEGINITAAIAANRALVSGYGGHPMAAGLSIDPERIPEFRLAISRTVQEMGIGIQKEKDLQIDGYLSLPEISLDLVEDLERLAPFGAGNPSLVFATRDLRLTGYAAVGRSGEHLQLTIEDELAHTQHSIWWQGAGYTLPETKFDLAYTVRASTYRGQRDVQIEWIDYRLSENASITLKHARSDIQVIDLRNEMHPVEKILTIQQSDTLTVWGEADARSQIDCLDRFTLHPADKLVIWTIPPGRAELQVVLEKVAPTQVYLFADDPGMDDAQAFLKRLAGLVKHRLKYANGVLSLNALAAATAQCTVAVKAGLDWLEANGSIKIIQCEADEVVISTGAQKKKADFQQRSAQMNTLLAESAAFRRYYLTAAEDRLVLLENDRQVGSPIG